MSGPPDSKGDLTLLLREAAKGDAGAMDRAVRIVYGDLERLARKQLGRIPGRRPEDLTLEPAALVHESFLKLLEQRRPYKNRAHFFAIATKVMLRALIDYERARAAERRGGGQVRVTLTGLAADARGPTLTTATDLAMALDKLEAHDARKAAVVKLHGLWGMTMKEVAATLDVSLATAERDWSFARAWLASALSGKS